jgi:hypothetical protein
MVSMTQNVVVGQTLVAPLRLSARNVMQHVDLILYAWVRISSCRGHWGEIVESTGSRPGLHDLSFLPTSIAALLAVVFRVMLNRPGVT